MRRQLAWLSLVLMLAVAALLAQGSACGGDQQTLARVSARAAADCDLVTCPLRTAPAVARMTEEQCAGCPAALRAQPGDDEHVHIAAVANQPLERAWLVRSAAPHRLDERGVAYPADLLAFAPSARDDSAANRAPPSA